MCCRRSCYRGLTVAFTSKPTAISKKKGATAIKATATTATAITDKKVATAKMFTFCPFEKTSAITDKKVATAKATATNKQQ